MPRVEKALRELKSKGRTGKTLRNYADGLAAFCDCFKKRDYLDHDPLEKLQPFDATPQTKRRALTPEEIQRLLAACQPNRKLTYEMAICTGLRAGELQGTASIPLGPIQRTRAVGGRVDEKPQSRIPTVAEMVT